LVDKSKYEVMTAKDYLENLNKNLADKMRVK
jgi:hypothetical protein